ncbi:hypothetical protein K435DRAFT_506989 [Dendrothele bispora CBS 962.96]|uniref:Uncharacterized protein n=1 Tax=Dendrothele bispora (strain CBS 962.96) TaxID=1314807 RepID=A0A4S8MVD9_DENBC|nr:hypothetical protein K435DRAFT_506989 [Dendrothele bispora CBS 962.96]
MEPLLTIFQTFFVSQFTHLIPPLPPITHAKPPLIQSQFRQNVFQLYCILNPPHLFVFPPKEISSVLFLVGVVHYVLYGLYYMLLLYNLFRFGLLTYLLLLISLYLWIFTKQYKKHLRPAQF